MNRFLELAKKENRTKIEELEYDFLDKQETLHGLIETAKRFGNKNWQNNFMIKDAYEKYALAKQKYENARI